MYHICFVYIYQLNGYRELNLFEEACFTLVAIYIIEIMFVSPGNWFYVVLLNNQSVDELINQFRHLPTFHPVYSSDTAYLPLF